MFARAVCFISCSVLMLLEPSFGLRRIYNEKGIQSSKGIELSISNTQIMRPGVKNSVVDYTSFYGDYKKNIKNKKDFDHLLIDTKAPLRNIWKGDEGGAIQNAEMNAKQPRAVTTEEDTTLESEDTTISMSTTEEGNLGDLLCEIDGKDPCNYGTECEWTDTLCNTPKTQDQILDLHNTYRNDHAYNKTIKDMRVMSHGREMIFKAFCYSAHCALDYKKWKIGCDEIDIKGYALSYSIKIDLRQEMDLDDAGPWVDGLFNNSDFSDVLYNSAYDSVGCARRYFAIDKFKQWKAQLMIICVYGTVSTETCEQNQTEYQFLCGTFRNFSSDTYTHYTEFDAKDEEMYFVTGTDECINEPIDTGFAHSTSTPSTTTTTAFPFNRSTQSIPSRPTRRTTVTDERSSRISGNETCVRDILEAMAQRISNPIHSAKSEEIKGPTVTSPMTPSTAGDSTTSGMEKVWRNCSTLLHLLFYCYFIAKYLTFVFV